MTASITCRHSPEGCDYPEGECSGACMRAFIDANTQRAQGRAQGGANDEPEHQRVDDSLVAAGICLAGLVLMIGAGMCVGVIAWAFQRFF